MKETWSDSKLELKWGIPRAWGDACDVLRVYAPDGTLLYTSVTDFIHQSLSPRQATWIREHFQAKRKRYVFV